MYVNAHGVIEEPQQDPYCLLRERPSGRLGTPVQASPLRQFTAQINNAGVVVLIVALLASAGFALAIRNNAQAIAPSAVSSFGKAESFGNPQVKSGDEVVAMAHASDKDGYWIVTRRGHIFPYGEAFSYGEIPEGILSNVIDVASTPTGEGYWILASNGNVYTYGDAGYFGTPEEKGVFGHTYVALLPSESGDGYTLVESTGDVAVFGDAHLHGSANGQLGGDIIVDAKSSSTGEGYLMVSAKGAVYAFGDAQFRGSMSAGQTTQAVALTYTTTGKGYWILTSTGTVFPYGDAVSYESDAVTPTQGARSVDMALTDKGDGYWVASGGLSPSKTAAQQGRKAVPSGSSAAPAARTTTASGDNQDVWSRLRNCESHGNYSTNTGNGYYGAYQFSQGTWNSMNTGYERADLAPPEVQDDAARRLQARSGWGQWPVCSRNAGAYN